MKHVPDAIDEVNSGSLGGGGGDGDQSGETILQSAQLFEQNGNYHKAIDRYLEIRENHFPSPDRCAEAWESAFTLALRSVKDRIHEVVGIVGQRLCHVEKFGMAADMYD